MSKKSKSRRHWKKVLLASLAAFVLLASLVILFNQVIGWATFSLISFWLFLTPATLYFVPRLWVKGFQQLLSSLLAALLFYLMIFVFIYKDYKEQFNTIIFIGLLVSVVSLLFLHFYRRKIR